MVRTLSLTRGKLVTLAVLMALLVALATSYAASRHAHAAPVENGHAPLVHVGPNPSSCTGPFTGSDSGVVNVHIHQNGNFLNVSVHDASPNTTYVVDIRCVGKIGTLDTNSEGTGTAQIDLPSSLPASFFIDVSVPPPGGAGAGGYGDTFIAGPFSN